MGASEILNERAKLSQVLADHMQIFRDFFSVPGVSHVVLLDGINDIGFSGRTQANPDGWSNARKLESGFIAPVSEPDKNL
jgi:hypothetical protein